MKDLLQILLAEFGVIIMTILMIAETGAGTWVRASVGLSIAWFFLVFQFKRYD